MTKDEEALVKSVRARHHPYFAQLEEMMHVKLPHFDELSIAFAVCTLLEQVEAVEALALCETNPGLDQVQ